MSTAHLLSTSTIMFFKSALFSLAAIAAAKEMPKDEVLGAQLYDSGIRHANNMALKHVSVDCCDHLLQKLISLVGTMGCA